MGPLQELEVSVALKASTSRLFLHISWASILLAISGISLAAQSASRDIKPVDAVQGIVAAFQQHSVVIIGEAHWLRQAGDFYIDLVRDPAFQEPVQDIVVEFASRNNQPLLDRYIAGEDVPVDEVRHIWRDTTKVASWESPIYAEWLVAIRKVNKKLPPARRLRVLAGDTPIDWHRILTHSDWAALGDNNISIADVMLEQVLKKKHRALVVLGSNHVTKSGDRDGADNVTTRIESRYPGATYVVLLDSVTTLNSASQELLRISDRNAPALYEIAGAPLEKATGNDGLPLIKKADALLYLGPPEKLTLTFPPSGSLEPAYLQEVDRRSMIEWGELRARKFLGPAAQ
jgi:Haem-binding uptake, Tiki superfamily, ChaN